MAIKPCTLRIVATGVFVYGEFCFNREPYSVFWGILMQDFFTFNDWSIATAVLPVACDFQLNSAPTFGKLVDPVLNTMHDNFPDPPKPK